MILFAFYSSLHSLFTVFQNGEVANTIAHVATLVIGLCVYFSSTYYGELFQELKYYRTFLISLILAFVPLIILGDLQLINQFSGKLSFVNNITSFFAQNVYDKRIQGVSGEPSWAMLHILTGLVLFLFFLRGKKSLFILTVIINLIILFVCSFSFYGYLVLGFSLILYMIFTKKVKNLFLGVLILLVLFIGLKLILLDSGISNYSINRFSKLSNITSFKDVLFLDGSFFVRITFPLIGFIEFIRHPIFGLGGGNSYLEFKQILLSYFPEGIKYPEVYFNAFINNKVFTPRNLFSKILAEEGIIGITLFLGFLITFYKKFCKGNISVFTFFLVIAIFLNFDSYATIDCWLLLGLIKSGFFDRGLNVERKNSIYQHNFPVSNG
ncbi:O-antigen ligase family protein [Scopulibacillus cellulosilyticus]|uniref:O-antigen ligase family protein n=1 Tax=Scopulibacillus cellulosilyticus TaxID=2665665 RepID=A0ABW2PWG8_9BACL